MGKLPAFPSQRFMLEFQNQMLFQRHASCQNSPKQGLSNLPTHLHNNNNNNNNNKNNNNNNNSNNNYNGHLLLLAVNSAQVPHHAEHN